MKHSLLLLVLLACVMLLGFAAQPHGQAPSEPPEALTGFDNLSNGFSDAARRTADQTNFEEVEHIAPDGLGPIYNAQSCRECHQTPVTGAASQVMEVRVGHLLHGQFQNPAIPIDDGKEVITGRTLVNDRAICPQIQEHVPASETIRTTRLATNVLGDGYVEAIADATLLKIRRDQCQASHGKICGQAIYVPVPPSEGAPRIGRFGWKDQHASLLFFAGDAYLNEMGITNSLEPDEVTTICNPPVTTANPNNDPTKITEPNSLPQRQRQQPGGHRPLRQLHAFAEGARARRRHRSHGAGEAGTSVVYEDRLRKLSRGDDREREESRVAGRTGTSSRCGGKSHSPSL